MYLSCIPSVAFGFLKYNGMYFENIVVIFLRYLVTPKKLKYKSYNLYYELLDYRNDNKRSVQMEEKK